MNEIEKMIQKNYDLNEGIYYKASSTGYWSNFSREDQNTLFSALKDHPSKDVIASHFPQYYDMIYNNSRCVGLELLQIDRNDVGIDYGCMWGNVMVYCAKYCKTMIGVDQTEDSLKFLKVRLDEENIQNSYLINANLRDEIDLTNMLDFSIINGVMEWVPDTSVIDLQKHFKKSKFRLIKASKNPRSEQLKFLKMVNNNLNSSGKLYLAIENRFDYQYFLWKRDPHSNLMYTAFLPRIISNMISNLYYGRPYVNYIYSKKELDKILREAGFNDIKIYATFPDYRFPQKIIFSDSKDDTSYSPVYSPGKREDIIARIFRKARYMLDILIYKKLKMYSLAPSFIVIARK